jgi:RND family efflux transporter MFP subunit
MSNRSHLISGSLSSALLLTALASVGAGCDARPQPQEASAAVTDPAPHVPVAPVVSTASLHPAPSDSRSFTTTGPLVAEQQADISAEREGRVVNIVARIGDRVKKGQLLAQLDDRALRATCESQKARIASAEAQVHEWEAEQKSAQADLRRADSMRADKIISEEQWEHVKYRVDETIFEVERFRNEVVAAQADFDNASVQLEQSRIIAPFSGVVGRSTIRLAQEVHAGDVLFWITAEAPLQVLFTVPETAMAAFTVGAQLELTTADYPGLRQAGRIARVSPVVDPASGSVQVIGAVVRPSAKLKPGMSIQVRLAP